jgi:uncharacterized protein
VTPDVRQSADPEMAHADDALRAADALLGLKLANEAASRLYYAVFHAARALLFSVGIAPTSHDALRSLVGLHFIRAGRLPTACAKDLAELEGLRLAGDYDPHFAMSLDDVAQEVPRVRRFIDDCKRALANGG